MKPFENAVIEIILLDNAAEDIITTSDDEGIGLPDDDFLS